MSKGLKINNEKSTVPTVNPAASESFKDIANEAADRLMEYKKRSWDLGVKFKGIMESLILPENKSVLTKDFESETLAQLSQLAGDINSDMAQPDGAGSIALSQLIMKMILLQKDMNNQQKFKVDLLEKQVATLKDKIELLEKTNKRNAM